MSKCKKCKHLIMFDYKNRSYSCELGECKFDPEEQEPTTKNNLGVDCIVDVLGSYTDLDIPYKREIAENILAKLPSVTPQEPFMAKSCISSRICEHDKVVTLDKIRAEIAEYGSIWVEYKMPGGRDKYIEQLVNDVLKQAKEQVLDIIDKHKAEAEDT